GFKLVRPTSYDVIIVASHAGDMNAEEFAQEYADMLRDYKRSYPELKIKPPLLIVAIKYNERTKVSHYNRIGYFTHILKPLRRKEIQQAMLSASRSNTLSSSLCLFSVEEKSASFENNHNGDVLNNGRIPGSGGGTDGGGAGEVFIIPGDNMGPNVPYQEQSMEEIHQSRQELNVSAAAGSTTPLKPDEERSKLRILLVDDQDSNLQVVTLMLNRLGCTPQCVANGEDAAWRVCRTEETWDLVFMDLFMPVLDGFSATKRIREWEQKMGRTQPTTCVPIVALTAAALDSDRQK
ncbi:unnamed protein product, partial [marine sediment metagenome]